MRTILAGSVAIILVCVSLAGADLVTPRKREVEQKILPFSLRVYTEAFKKNEMARVIASGAGESCLGLYVFDAQGNCVARDDFSDARTADDLFADWIPAEQERFSVEIRNAG